jgi:hypothetical protein
MTQRENILVGCAIGFGVVAVAWMAMVFMDARRTALAAADDLAESRRLAASLQEQRASGISISASVPKEAEVTRRIESAARKAELPEASIARIEPGQSQRIDGGRLTEKSTVVELKNVTLRQLFTFLHAMGTGQSSLNLKQVRLSVPVAEDTGDRWSVESTLTYLVRTPGDERASASE